MDITDVRVRKIAADGKLRGIASITFDDAFVVDNTIRVQCAAESVNCSVLLCCRS